MAARTTLLLIGTIIFCFSANAQNVGAVVSITLSPAGSFKAESTKVTGTAQKTADGVKAENIEVHLKNLSTGVSLRDKHAKEYLMVDKYPTAKLIKAEGKGGKGKATVEIKGVQKEVTGTYKIVGSLLQAQFKLLLSDVKIKVDRYMGVGPKDEVTINVTVPIK